jgi:hypothetical protein
MNIIFKKKFKLVCAELIWLNKFDNPFIIFINKMFIDFPKQLSFYFIYIFLKFYKNIKLKFVNEKNTNNLYFFKTFFKNLFKNFFFKYSILLLTSYPYIVIKKNIVLTKTIYIEIKTRHLVENYNNMTNLEVILDVIYGIFANCIIKFTGNIACNVHNLAIIFENNRLILNPSDLFKFLSEKLKSKKEFIIGCTDLAQNCQFRELKHFNIKSHPSMFFYNENKSELIIINETSKNIINFGENNQQQKLLFPHKGSINESCTTYFNKPYVTNEFDILKLNSAKFLQNIKYRGEIKYFFAKANGLYYNDNLLEWKNNNLNTNETYNTLKNYIIGNENNLDSNLVDAFKKINYFHEINKDLLENELKSLSNEDKLNFIFKNVEFENDVLIFFSKIIDK